jgi:hypothetical protein
LANSRIFAEAYSGEFWCVISDEIIVRFIFKRNCSRTPQNRPVPNLLRYFNLSTKGRGWSGIGGGVLVFHLAYNSFAKKGLVIFILLNSVASLLTGVRVGISFYFLIHLDSRK